MKNSQIFQLCMYISFPLLYKNYHNFGSLKQHVFIISEGTCVECLWWPSWVHCSGPHKTIIKAWTTLHSLLEVQLGKNSHPGMCRLSVEFVSLWLEDGEPWLFAGCWHRLHLVPSHLLQPQEKNHMFFSNMTFHFMKPAGKSRCSLLRQTPVRI